MRGPSWAQPPTPTLMWSAFGKTQPYPPGTVSISSVGRAAVARLALGRHGRVALERHGEEAVGAEAERLRRDPVGAVGADDDLGA